jgi:hypothetical protein
MQSTKMAAQKKKSTLLPQADLPGGEAATDTGTATHELSPPAHFFS